MNVLRLYFFYTRLACCLSWVVRNTKIEKCTQKRAQKGRRNTMKNPHPKIKRRKDRDLAYIVIEGKRIHLGRWGSAESLKKYAQIITDPTFASAAEQGAINESIFPLKEVRNKRRKNASVDDATISILFFAYIRSYQTRPRYSRTDLNRIRHTLSVILETVNDVRIEDFGIIQMGQIKDRLMSSTFRH